MTRFYIILTIIGILALSNCSSDGPDFIGTYIVQSIQDECPDPSNNGSVNRDKDGVCLLVSGEQECIDMTLLIEDGGTYSLTTQLVSINGGIRFSQAPETSTGTYITEGNDLTLQGRNDVFELNDSETSLKWIVTTTSQGCDRSYTFNKRL